MLFVSRHRDEQPRTVESATAQAYRAAKWKRDTLCVAPGKLYVTAEGTFETQGAGAIRNPANTK
jgi:hypothetical protein